MLAPSQIGVGVRNAADAVIYSAHQWVKESGNNPKVGLLKIDFRNVFKMVSRAAMLRAVAEHFPSIYNYVELCYGSYQHAVLWHDPIRLHSVKVCQQGDP